MVMVVLMTTAMRTYGVCASDVMRIARGSKARRRCMRQSQKDYAQSRLGIQGSGHDRNSE
jgi:hypothetical protein